MVKSAFPFAVLFSGVASDEEAATVLEELVSAVERGEKDAAGLLSLSTGMSLSEMPVKLLLLGSSIEMLPAVVWVVGDLEAMELRKDLVMV